jgi:hypothetical protein
MSLTARFTSELETLRACIPGKIEAIDQQVAVLFPYPSLDAATEYDKTKSAHPPAPRGDASSLAGTHARMLCAQKPSHPHL